MKKVFVLLLSLFPALCVQGKVSRSPEAEALRHRLENLVSRGVMFGHHDDPVYGIGWWGDENRSDVRSVCGDFPAVFSFDIGDMEHDSAQNLDKVSFERIRREIIRHHEQGGITTISWHVDNPLTGGDSWDVSNANTVASVLENGEKNALFLTWLDRTAAFFNTLKDENGVKIPLIFRPWHEHTGSWFWWGQKLCTTEEYKALWQLTVDRMQANGATQLLYAYSPGQEPNDTTAYLERYPGDALIDILGTDVYCFNTTDYRYHLDKMLKIITSLGKTHEKIVAITETGYETIPDSLWWTETLLPLVEKYPVSYLVVWRNAFERPNHFYAPYPGQVSAKDFVRFYKKANMLFLKDMRFVRAENGQLFIGEKPYYFIGTNFWYGAILGSTGQGGNRERLLKELDFLHKNGMDNLRILVGADGVAGQKVKVMPTLQQSPGIYNDTIFEGLDFLLSEMGKRNMKAVLYLNNSWEWSGGYGQYLEWAGEGKVPKLGVQDWPVFQRRMSKYADCDSCKTLFFNHIKQVISRANRYTGKPYTEDPSIMAWQVGNEPRVFEGGNKEKFLAWLGEATALIRSLDGKHLISIGNEGYMGSEMDWNLVEKMNADPNVDYMTIHIWAKNWSWINTDSIAQNIDNAIVKTNEYITQHLEIAKSRQKPLVIEEFGYPRDNHLFTEESPTTARDKYYENIFENIVKSKTANGNLTGCNFWAWGGFGRAKHLNWEKGDDYLGDPSQEEQGLNSVFDVDETVKLVKQYTEKLQGNNDALYYTKFDGLALTPPMGWNSWNRFACNIDENLIRETADALVATGMKDAGYQYINIDDCWHGGRDSLGFIYPDKDRFPGGMKALADYVHSKGLKLGIYSCAGSLTCGGRPGSRGYEFQDAMQYAAWGIDYLKYDWCNTEGLAAEGAYKTIAAALKHANRPVVLSLCEWGNAKPWLWAENVGHLWRTTGDIENCFDCINTHNDTWNTYGVMKILDMQAGLRKYAGPGHWNDPDMLEIGNGKLTPSESRAHFTMWAMLCAPLIAGNDLRTMNKETVEILTNKDIIAINQDKLGIQALKYNDSGDLEIWLKPLENGDWAVAFLNRSTDPAEVNFDWRKHVYTDDEVSKLTLDAAKTTFKIKDLWNSKILGNTQKPLKTIIYGHDVVALRLSIQK